MSTQKQAGLKRPKMAERAEQQFNLHYPDFPPVLLWRRKTNDGYSTIPRMMPLAMQALDEQTKGQPAGHTLLCLWMRSPDHPMITIENPATFAAEAGFYGERAVDTWRRRMRALKEFGFIDSKNGPSGDFHYVLLLSPTVAVEKMRQKSLVQDGLYARFTDRLIEIGGFRDIEAFRKYEEELKAAEEKAKAPAKRAAKKPTSSKGTTAPAKSTSVKATAAEV